MSDDAAVRLVPATRFEAGTSSGHAEPVAVEEPLAIRISYGPPARRERRTVAVTLRTPGADADLALGYLLAEGVITGPADVLAVGVSREPEAGGQVVRVDLHPDVTVDLTRLERASYTAGSCGVCGKTSLDAVETLCGELPAGGFATTPAALLGLPAKLRAAQPAFAQTGGLHAAALFDAAGTLHAVAEDVGRHNAVDKLLGAEFRAGRWPVTGFGLFVSSRAGFELVQKAAMARVAVFAAVGAPTTLAVELAERLGVTLAGFVREGRFTLYAGGERVRPPGGGPATHAPGLRSPG